MNEMMEIAPPAADGIAVIGMAGRLPGASDIRSFWRRLFEGADSITRFRAEDIDDSYTAQERARPDYVAARPVLEDIELFDAALFGMRPREAALTDPQQRIFLEICWEALEDAGRDPRACAGQSVGVFAGATLNTYLMRHVCGDRATTERFLSDLQVGGYEGLVGNIADALATRVAYKLDLRGPAMSIATACSTSLTAVAQAVQALLLHQCEMALAGGVSVTLPQRRGYFAQDGGMVSPDGTCRPFDAEANGTIFGSGAGVVLLKRLEDALADGDHVYAVIRGAAVNNDGASKVGFAAPSIDAQAEVIATAQAIAGFDPASIGYVECHGTATPLGDPIEVAALAKAFGPAGGPGSCLIGSVKGHVGHLDAAAGVTGLIKAVLAVESGTIPPTLHFRRPNPHLALERTPFAVAASTAAWPEKPGPRRAGVSALGVGGTNVHLCLEQAPPRPPAPAVRPARSLLTLSARSAEGLARARAALADRLRDDASLDLADVAHTLATGRHPFPHRCAVVAATRTEAIERLGTTQAPGLATGEAARTGRPVLFMFPGQGAQYPAMASGLYAEEPAFRAAMDRCAAILQPLLGRDLRDALYGAAGGDADAIRQTLLAQPAIFAVEFALAQLWLSRGVRPAAMIGHSVGEFVAATLAGILTLEDALAVVAERGRLMQSLPGGAMLAVRLPEAELAPLLPEGVDIGAVNGPALTVAAGPETAMAQLEARLAERGAMHRRLHTSHAFHSAMMEPILPLLEAAVARVPLAAPAIPYVSCVTGAWITEAEAGSPAYWARHCRAPVRFAEALATLLAGHEGALLLEIGPGAALGTLALQGAMRGNAASVIASLPDAAREQPDAEAFATAWGRLWVSGAAVEPGLAIPSARRVSLPATPFEHRRHWIEAPALASAEAPPTLPDPQPEEDRMPPSPSTDPETGQAVLTLFEELSGESLAGTDADATSFLELGFDSLFLSQAAQQIQARFGLKVTFRQLMSDLATPAALTRHIAAALPPKPAPAARPAAPAVAAPVAIAPVMPTATAGSDVQALLQAQLAAMTQLMQAQLAAIGTGTAAVPPPAPAAVQPPAAPAPAPAATEMTNRFARFTNPRQARASAALTEAQQRFVEALAARLAARAPSSKAHTQRYRAVHADPRTAAGFRPEWKELVFPLVCERAEGGRVTDIDGNTYIDLVSGFGPVLLGHAEQEVVEAVIDEMRRGAPIGPQARLAGPVAELIAELTGCERVSFCCTGSEAVMGALRLARAVTGRKRVASFAGAYHGGFDEVLARGIRVGGEPRTLPAAAGITEEATANLTILEYGDPDALAWIERHAHELAAVLVEPVQSRHPALQPRAFLQRLRAVTEASGTALIFDEVVTGFRLHPGGAQALFGIAADLATYGKVLGGGLPIGVLAGKARFMDALDGGHWSFGDASGPETDVTVFAGTFVRHPLALAAAHAMLTRLKAEGATLWERLEARAAWLATRLDAALAERGIPARTERCGTVLQFNLAALDRRASLLYPLLRERGIFAQEGFALFLTAAHGEAECARVAEAFAAALDALQSVGILLPEGAALPASVAPPPAEAPLTEPQMEIWLAAQNGDESSCAFNESVGVEIAGALDTAALAAALGETVARHDALRARFAPEGDRMLIAPEARLPFAEDDISGLPEAEREAALAAIVEQDASTPFDLVAGPPVRARLVRRGPADHVLVFTAHHIVCDGWSTGLLLREAAALYEARRNGAAAALPPARSFAAQAMAEQARGPDQAALDYWAGRFATLPTALELPADRPRPAVKTLRGATRRARLDASLVAALRKAGARQGCTLFVTLMAGAQMLLGRLAGQDEVVIGVPMAGQSRDQEANGQEAPCIGHHVNFLPIRAGWTEGTTLGGHMATLQRTMLDAAEHQNTTLSAILRRLGLKRSPNRMPLTDVVFNLDRLDTRGSFGDPQAATRVNDKAFVNFDLYFNLIEDADGIQVACNYSTDLFDAATIDRWLGHYRTLLAAMAADPSLPVHAAPLLTEAEQQSVQLVADGTACAWDPARTVLELFAGQVARRPEAIAVACGEAQWTYAELDRRSSEIAAHLAGRILGSEARVGVLVERSLDMLASLLAVMRAGFAYVPMDPRHPEARLAAVIARSELAALLVDATSVGIPTEIPKIALHQPLPPLAVHPAAGPVMHRASPDKPAYVIFTSGSTGVPKGVQVGHRALSNLLSTMARRPGMTEDDALLSVAPVSFDMSVPDWFLPLVTGGRVVIASRDEAMDGFALLARLQSSGATMMQATPATWRILLEAGFSPPRGFKMLCGGEGYPRELADQLLRAGQGELWNMYGPTETTVWSACGRILDDGAPITIGEPMTNTRLLILDAHDQPVPPGIAGQLHIGGTGVADGYINDTTLTAEKFVADPFAGTPGARMYRTGDLARLLPGGGMQLLGRGDTQVKLRGFRIELGDIEAALLRTAGVAAAVVQLRTDPPRAPRLVAYYTERPGAPRSPDELRAALAEVLPDYMVPGAYMRLPALPLTPNGKADRKALPAPEDTAEASAAAAGARRAPLATPLQQRLGAIWQDVLGLPEIGAEDDVLALGADSIHLFQIVSRARRSGLAIAAKDLMKHRTVAALAAVLEAEAPAPGAAQPPAARPLPKLSQFQRQGRTS